jgi:carbon storage regulator
MSRLVLSRKQGQSINIGSNVTVKLIDISRNEARILIIAPPEVSVDRSEVRRRKIEEEGFESEEIL